MKKENCEMFALANWSPHICSELVAHLPQPLKSGSPGSGVYLIFNLKSISVLGVRAVEGGGGLGLSGGGYFEKLS
jgi:hypothetical protein